MLKILHNYDQVRFSTLRMDVKNGLYRVYWDLDKKGLRFLSRRTPKPNANEPGGLSILLCNYKVILEYGKEKDSTPGEVKILIKKVLS